MGNEDKECGFGREILPEATQDEVKQKVPQGEQPGTQGTDAPRGGGSRWKHRCCITVSPVRGTIAMGRKSGGSRITASPALRVMDRQFMGRQIPVLERCRLKRTEDLLKIILE